MVEMIRDDRKVIQLSDGTYRFTLQQEQIYEQVTVDNMIKTWKSQLEQYQAFLDNYDRTVEDGIEKLKEQMELQKKKVLMEIDFITEGLTLWSNPELAVKFG